MRKLQNELLGRMRDELALSQLEAEVIMAVDPSVWVRIIESETTKRSTLHRRFNARGLLWRIRWEMRACIRALRFGGLEGVAVGAVLLLLRLCSKRVQSGVALRLGQWVAKRYANNSYIKAARPRFVGKPVMDAQRIHGRLLHEDKAA